MRVGRVLAVGGALLLLALLVWVGATTYWNMQQPSPQDFALLVRAMEELAHDRAKAGRPVPSNATLGELVTNGYLSTAEAKIFDDMDILVSLTGDVNLPHKVHVRIQLPGSGTIEETVERNAFPGTNAVTAP